MSDSQGKQVQVQQPAVDLPNRWEVELEVRICLLSFKQWTNHIN